MSQASASKTDRDEALGGRLSDRHRRVEYEVIAGDVPMTGYSSVLTLNEIAEGDRTYAVWTAKCELVGDPAETEEWVRHGIFRTCLDELERVVKAER